MNTLNPGRSGIGIRVGPRRPRVMAPGRVGRLRTVHRGQDAA
ncbi:hypothetical protein ACWCXE_27330 [Streptomyces sp. NPDC001780]